MNGMNFYKGKKVLVTGHTGFKGTWLCHVLLELGAQVYGYALEPPTKPSLYELSGIAAAITSEIGDIRDLKHLQEYFDRVQPEIVIHMAAQPIVRESYRCPVTTYEVNVMGTVHVLECIRNTPAVKSFVNVTTDKVYKNKEWEWGYRENEELNGYDPYSNSKSCSELVTDSYKNSFFSDKSCAISTARAGNVIGGGDFAADRIVPDCMRAILEEKDIAIRNPYSIRPYQHVLEPLAAYLLIAKRQYEDGSYAGNYNVGPDDENCLTTGQLVSKFCEVWNEKTHKNLKWYHEGDCGPHEANFLKLDCAKLKSVFQWQPRWNADVMLAKTVEWIETYVEGQNVSQVMKSQILEYFSYGKTDNFF